MAFGGFGFEMKKQVLKFISTVYGKIKGPETIVEPFGELNERTFEYVLNPMVIANQTIQRNEQEISSSLVNFIGGVKSSGEKQDANVKVIETRFNKADKFKFKRLPNGVCILRGTLNQADKLFGENAGNQGTSMVASFLAHAFLYSPAEWSNQVLDAILTCGDEFYTEKRSKLNLNFLGQDESTGNIIAFSDINLSIEIDKRFFWDFQGFVADNCMENKLYEFIEKGLKCGSIVLNGFAMGIFVEKDFVYFFDSHSRGLLGYAEAEGTACVIKIDINIAPAIISHFIYQNCLPIKAALSDIQITQFCITPFICKIIKH